MNGIRCAGKHFYMSFNFSEINGECALSPNRSEIHEMETFIGA